MNSSSFEFSISAYRLSLNVVCFTHNTTKLLNTSSFSETYTHRLTKHYDVTNRYDTLTVKLLTTAV